MALGGIVVFSTTKLRFDYCFLWLTLTHHLNNCNFALGVHIENDLNDASRGVYSIVLLFIFLRDKEG